MTNMHELKILPEYFSAVVADDKRFELRKDDRGFKVGDCLQLREWSEASGYTGRSLTRRITFISRGEPWLAPGYIAASLQEVL